jgi:hypothetical protein
MQQGAKFQLPGLVLRSPQQHCVPRQVRPLEAGAHATAQRLAAPSRHALKQLQRQAQTQELVAEETAEQ